MSVNTSTSTPETTGFFAGINKALPFIQWAMMIAVAVGLYAVASRDTQKDQSFEINNLKTGQQQIKEDAIKRNELHEKQFDSIKKEMLTRDVFEAYMKAIANEQEQQRRLTERILENQK